MRIIMVEKQILNAPGTNREGDLAKAIRLFGGDPIIESISRLKNSGRHWEVYTLLVVPGGLSYGEALNAGRL